jgi:DnaJ-class molecular chaperone
MSQGREIHPGHEQIRGVLRVVGPLIALVGLGFLAVGVISFFSAFGTFEPPRHFWCAFVGIPLLGIGGALTQYGYLGSMMRYFAGEVAPVQKDTFNYLAEGTSEGVRTVARSVGRGFAEGAGGFQGQAEVRCPKCQGPNPADAGYCNRCGTALGPRTCPNCSGRNDPAARFCGHCGAELA